MREMKHLYSKTDPKTKNKNIDLVFVHQVIWPALLVNTKDPSSPWSGTKKETLSWVQE